MFGFVGHFVFAERAFDLGVLWGFVVGTCLRNEFEASEQYFRVSFVITRSSEDKIVGI